MYKMVCTRSGYIYSPNKSPVFTGKKQSKVSKEKSNGLDLLYIIGLFTQIVQGSGIIYNYEEIVSDMYKDYTKMNKYDKIVYLKELEEHYQILSMKSKDI